MPNGTYGGVRGKETKVGQKTFVSQPTRFVASPVVWLPDSPFVQCSAYEGYSSARDN